MTYNINLILPFFTSLFKSCRQTFRHQVQSGAQSPFKKWLLNLAVERKFAEVKAGIIRNNSVWDKLIFNKVQVRHRGRREGVETGSR